MNLEDLCLHFQNVNNVKNGDNNSDKNLEKHLEILNNYNDTDWEQYKYKYEKNEKNITNSDKFINYHKNMVFSNDYCDIYIITWFTKSVIHDHAENGCIFKVLHGKLSEEKYKKDNGYLEFVNSRILKTNDSGYIDNRIGYHKMINIQSQPSYSINIYSPSKYKCKEIK